MKILFINLPYYGHVVPTIGLVYGVPMVVIPFVSDQPVNARCAEILIHYYEKMV